MAEQPALPPGFTLDPAGTAPGGNNAQPALPPGFNLDAPPAKTEVKEKPRLSFDQLLAAGVAGAKKYFSEAPVIAPVAGLAELGAQQVTGGASAIAGGLAGFAGADPEQIQQSATYQPQTVPGQMLERAAGLGVSALAQGGHAVADPIGAKSPLAGAAVYTATQMAPALLTRGAGRTLARARGDIPAPRPSATKPETGAKTSTAAAESRAKDYVSRNTALDWDRLSARVKQTLTNIASDAQNLSKLDPKAVERQARLESLRVPVKGTRGQLMRDEGTLRQENVTADTPSGKPIRAMHDAQNQALLENLEVLKGRVRGRGRTAGTAETPEQVGQSVQDQALRAKLSAKKAEVTRLYKEAKDQGELQGSVATRPLARLIKESPDLQHLGWVDSWLKRAGVETKTKGKVTPGNRLKATVNELEDLRQAAVARAMNGGTEGYYAGKVISAIDEATEGAGGKAYQAARKARREQAMEFEEQGAVAKLVENKSRTDRATALESTWRQTVLSGTIDDVRKVKRSLMTGGTRETRLAGRKAWRDIRAQTIQHIIDESTKGVATRSTGAANITPAAMQKAIRSIGPDKMREIFGEQTVREINEILEATRDLKTEPPPSHAGASTAANLLSILEKTIGRVPYIGDVTTGAVRAGIKLREMGKTGREVREATTTPLAEAEVGAASGARRKALAKRYGAAQSLASVRATPRDE